MEVRHCVTSSRSTTMAPRRRQPRRSSWPSRRFHDRSGGWRANWVCGCSNTSRPTANEANRTSVLVYRAGPDGQRRSGPGRGHSTRHEPITTNSRCSNHLLPGSPRDGPRCWGVLVSGRIGRAESWVRVGVEPLAGRFSPQDRLLNQRLRVGHLCCLARRSAPHRGVPRPAAGCPPHDLCPLRQPTRPISDPRRCLRGMLSNPNWSSTAAPRVARIRAHPLAFPHRSSPCPSCTPGAAGPC